jgi:hypothetical protein
LLWQGSSFASGFTLELKYNRRVRLGGDAIGLSDDFDMTPQLAHFFTLNGPLLESQLPSLQTALADYRYHHHQECIAKSDVLSYGFLTHMYEEPRGWAQRDITKAAEGRDEQVFKLLRDNAVILHNAYLRFTTVTSCEARTWWYLFWVRFLYCYHCVTDL